MSQQNGMKKRALPGSACEQCRWKKIKCVPLFDRLTCQKCEEKKGNCSFKADQPLSENVKGTHPSHTLFTASADHKSKLAKRKKNESKSSTSQSKSKKKSKKLPSKSREVKASYPEAGKSVVRSQGKVQKIATYETETENIALNVKKSRSKMPKSKDGLYSGIATCSRMTETSSAFNNDDLRSMRLRYAHEETGSQQRCENHGRIGNDLHDTYSGNLFQQPAFASATRYSSHELLGHQEQLTGHVPATDYIFTNQASQADIPMQVLQKPSIEDLEFSDGRRSMSSDNLGGLERNRTLTSSQYHLLSNPSAHQPDVGNTRSFGDIDISVRHHQQELTLSVDHAFWPKAFAIENSFDETSTENKDMWRTEHQLTRNDLFQHMHRDSFERVMGSSSQLQSQSYAEICEMPTNLSLNYLPSILDQSSSGTSALSKGDNLPYFCNGSSVPSTQRQSTSLELQGDIQAYPKGLLGKIKGNTRWCDVKKVAEFQESSEQSSQKQATPFASRPLRDHVTQSSQRPSSQTRPPERTSLGQSHASFPSELRRHQDSDAQDENKNKLRIFSSTLGDVRGTNSDRDLQLFDTLRPRFPKRELLLHLISLFDRLYRASCFPWLGLTELSNCVKSNELPAMTANAICALMIRFSERIHIAQVHTASERFAQMAKSLMIPMLCCPSLEVIEALLILSYAEHRAGADAGFRMYVGMASRMAIDLGLQSEVSIRSLPTQEQQDRARCVFWALVNLDRIIVFSTDSISVLPDEICNSDLTPLDGDFPLSMIIFGYVVRALLKRGRIAQLLRGSAKQREESWDPPKLARIQSLWLDFASLYRSLPSCLHLGAARCKDLSENPDFSALIYLHSLLLSTFLLCNKPHLLCTSSASHANDLRAPPELDAIVKLAPETLSKVFQLALKCEGGKPCSKGEWLNANACIDCNPHLSQVVLLGGRAFLLDRSTLDHRWNILNMSCPARLTKQQRQQLLMTHASEGLEGHERGYIRVCQRIVGSAEGRCRGASLEIAKLLQDLTTKNLED